MSICRACFSKLKMRIIIYRLWMLWESFMRQPAPAAMPVRILEQYGRYFEVNDARYTQEPAPAPPPGAGPGSRRYEVNPLFGSGWTDMHEFGNGVLVGRMHCRFSRTFEDEYTA